METTIMGCIVYSNKNNHHNSNNSNKDNNNVMHVSQGPELRAIAPELISALTDGAQWLVRKAGTLLPLNLSCRSYPEPQFSLRSQLRVVCKCL